MSSAKILRGGGGGGGQINRNILCRTTMYTCMDNYMMYNVHTDLEDGVQVHGTPVDVWYLEGHTLCMQTWQCMCTFAWK